MSTCTLLVPLKAQFFPKYIPIGNSVASAGANGGGGQALGVHQHNCFSVEI